MKFSDAGDRFSPNEGALQCSKNPSRGYVPTDAPCGKHCPFNKEIIFS